MRKIYRTLYYWLPPLIWMGIIFYFSSRFRTDVTGTFIYDFIFFKSLHIGEYSVLYFLLFRGFNSLNKKLTVNEKYIFSLLISILYAVSDELHQTYVPTREGQIKDVFIDSFGVFIMYIYIRSNFKFVNKFFR